MNAILNVVIRIVICLIRIKVMIRIVMCLIRFNVMIRIVIWYESCVGSKVKFMSYEFTTQINIAIQVEAT